MVKKQLIQTIISLPRPHKFWVLALVIMIGVTAFSSFQNAPNKDIVSDIRLDERPSSTPDNAALPPALEPGKRYPVTLNSSETKQASITTNNLQVQPITAVEEQITASEVTPEWKTYAVKRGDNLAKIFKRAGLTPQDVYKVSKAGRDAKKLLKILPGHTLQVALDSDQKFAGLRYPFSKTATLLIEPQHQGLSSRIEQKTVHTRVHFASGDIDNSFWNAGVKAGLTDNQIMSLANVFGWDIDFALDIRAGDNFNIIYEQKFVEGEFIGNGNIVAAEFVNQGETFTAIRYKDGNYYTPEGRSMRKSFLRAPVNFKYISSSFKPRRFHPVLKRWKQHRGIDYAAKTGTPVVAAGDGKVIKAGYDKYNGHHVFIQHGEKYVTKYLHFSKRKAKKGQWVKQGQTIGLVGMTGLANGPHLHYEFLVNGVHKNPRTVTLPKANPIAKSEKKAFLALAKNYQGQLENNRRIMLAMNQ